MAEFIYPEVQNVPYEQAALLNNATPICKCNRGGGIVHTNGSGLITLKGNRSYSAKLSCNISLAEGATVGEIAIALAVNGEVLPVTVAAATPAAVGDFWNVSTFAEISVPCGCCETLSVENASPAPEGGTNPEIQIRNLNVDVNLVNN